MTKYNILLCPTLLFALASCVTDERSAGPAEGQQVQITVAASTTRAEEGLDEGDPADRTISSLRVPGYGAFDGELSFDNPVLLSPSGTGYEGTVWALTGTHNLFFLANVGEDVVKENIYELRKTTVNRSAFSSGAPIPMFAEMKEAVTITALSDVPDPAQGGRLPGTTDKEPLSVVLERLAIRLDITLTLDADRFDEWFTDGDKTIRFDNVAEQVRLLPGIDNAAPGSEPVTVEVDEDDVKTVGDKKVITIERIILPELCLTGENNIKGNGLTISILADEYTFTGVIPHPGGGYSLPRNTYLDIAAEAGEKAFDFEVRIADWTDISFEHEI